MRILPLLALLLALCALPASAVAQCGSGSLATTFADNNGQSGNMFDLTPNVDLTIACLDVNSRAVVGATGSLDFYYKSGTSVGFEQSPSSWTLVGNYSFVGNGRGTPTNVDLAGNGILFTAGQTHAIYLDAGAGGGLAYTNGGPVTYSNADLSLTTNCGNASNFGLVFFPRQWNGEVYYDAGGGSFRLSINGLIAGTTTTLSTTSGTPNGSVGIGYSITGGGPTTVNAGPCGAITADLSNPIRILGIVSADANGAASVSAPVPAGTTGIAVWFQALDVASCTLSNGLAELIG